MLCAVSYSADMGCKQVERTLEHLPPPRLLALNHMAQEVIPLPERGVLNLLRHALLHGSPQLGMLLQILGNLLRLLLHVEVLAPGLPLRTHGVLEEGVQRGVYDVQLCVEPRGVHHLLPRAVLALEEHRAGLSRGGALGGRRDGHGFAEEVADVGAELEEGFISGVLGLFDVLEALGGLGAEARDEAGRFFNDVGGERLGAVGVRFGVVRGGCLGGGGVGFVGDGSGGRLAGDGHIAGMLHEGGDAGCGLLAGAVVVLLALGGLGGWLACERREEAHLLLYRSQKAS